MNGEPSREASRTAVHQPTCLVCGAPLRTCRARYCSRACQQQAYRLRHCQPSLLDLVSMQLELNQRRQLAEHTVYECPTCETRCVGQQRCADCNTFARALGIGGPCPDCDAVVLLTDLLPLAVVRPLRTSRAPHP
jgi:hypothetical protein